MSKSTLYYPDGRKFEMDSQAAYACWLACSGTALRCEGDTLPVMGWEYYVPAPHEIKRPRRKTPGRR